MLLDRAKRDAQFCADLFVYQPGDYPPEDLELSWSELCKLRATFHHLGGARERLRYGGKQFVVAERFWQKIDCPAFHRLDPLSDIGVPSHEDDLLRSTFLRESPLESEAVEFRQLHFEHDARRTGVWPARQVLGGAGEDLDGVILPRQQSGEVHPDRPVVIHHNDPRFQLFHAPGRHLRRSRPCARLAPGALVLVSVSLRFCFPESYG